MAAKATSWKGWAFLGAGILVSIYLDPARPRRARNPARRKRRRPRVTDSPELQRAAKDWESFHWGRRARTVRTMRVADQPDTLVKLGDLSSVTYRTRKGRDPVTYYEHEFAETGGRRPVLAMDPQTRRLHIVGGTYSVEWRGIVG